MSFMGPEIDHNILETITTGFCYFTEKPATKRLSI